MRPNRDFGNEVVVAIAAVAVIVFALTFGIILSLSTGQPTPTFVPPSIQPTALDETAIAVAPSLTPQTDEGQTATLPTDVTPTATPLDPTAFMALAQTATALNLTIEATARAIASTQTVVVPTAISTENIVANAEGTVQAIAPTNVPQASETNTPQSTATMANTATATATLTDEPTRTLAATATFTDSPTSTSEPPTSTRTATNTDVPTSAPTSTDVETLTPTRTQTPNVTSTPENTATDAVTNTATRTPTVARTETYTPTNTNTATDVPTRTPSYTLTFTPTDTATRTVTNTATATTTSTATATQTATPSHTATDVPTRTPSSTPTNTDTSTATYTPTRTFTATATNTPSSTPSATATLTPSLTATASHTASHTSTRTASATNTPTSTSTLTQTNTFTPTATSDSIIPLACATPTGYVSYPLQAGDTLYAVARAVGVPLRELLTANCIPSRAAVTGVHAIAVPFVPEGFVPLAPYFPPTQAPGEIGTPALESVLAPVGCTDAGVIIQSPAAGSEVSGLIEVIGSASIERFGSYRLDILPAGASDFEVWQISERTVEDGELAAINTDVFGDGLHYLRLLVYDQFGGQALPCVIPLIFRSG